MSLFGKLSQTGNLTDLANVPATRTWQDGSVDVPLSAIPSDFGPWTYDAVNKVAVSSPSLLTSQQRASAVTLATAPEPASKLTRAAFYSIIDVAVSEINLLREWIVAFKVAVAGAATLAALKTAVANLPDMPDRTTQGAVATVKANIATHINAGDVD